MVKKCLIIDDVEVSRYASRIALKALGLECSEANDEESGIEALNKHLYDAVLLDCHLRHDSGLDVIPKIRKIRGYENTPIIVCSGVAGAEGSKKAHEAGANSYHEKPTTKEKLESQFKKLGIL